ncbi:MAG: signal peptide peptidase SppA [Marinilabilia sp.]
MKKFLKYTLAVIVGSVVSVFILMLGFILMVGIFAATSKQEVSVEDNSVLVLKFDGPVVERATEDPFADLMSEIMGQKAPLGLNQIRESIEKAARDERIKGIYLEPSLMMAGHATIEEIRNTLKEFKESGKFVVSFAPVYTQKAYHLASVADRIYLNPQGMLEFQGLTANRTFFKNTLEKLGVDMQVVRHGEFKSAVEPFTRSDMSDAAREQTEVYLHSIWDNLTANVAEARGLTVEGINETADEMPMFKTGDFLMQAGLIDGLKYKDEVINELKDSTETDYEKDINSIALKKYNKAYVPDEKKGVSKNKIAIIYGDGSIDGSETDGIISEDLSRTIREARRDSSIKAVVFRINSPGGSALGSEIIWREVQLTSESKPLVVSMGDLAASGGYYIASAADSIVAQPNTLTGSIGVFGLIPNVDGLMEKIGISTDQVKTNKFADMPALDRPLKPEEKDLMQAYVENTYDVFLQRCADGRNTTKAAIDSIGEGRVWSGENALERGLVDELGGTGRAIEMAAGMAELDDYRTVALPEILPPFEQLMKDLTGDASAYVRNLFLNNSEEMKWLKTIETLKRSYPIQARMPYDLNIN